VAERPGLSRLRQIAGGNCVEQMPETWQNSVGQRRCFARNLGRSRLRIEPSAVFAAQHISDMEKAQTCRRKARDKVVTVNDTIGLTLKCRRIFSAGRLPHSPLSIGVATWTLLSPISKRAPSAPTERWPTLDRQNGLRLPVGQPGLDANDDRAGIGQGEGIGGRDHAA
jgi:hypothetical protein